MGKRKSEEVTKSKKQKKQVEEEVEEQEEEQQEEPVEEVVAEENGDDEEEKKRRRKSSPRRRARERTEKLFPSTRTRAMKKDVESTLETFHTTLKSINSKNSSPTSMETRKLNSSQTPMDLSTELRSSFSIRLKLPNKPSL